MFKGIPGEQFHQFIASRTSNNIPQLPLSFHQIHGSSSNTTFPSFDHYSTSSHHQQMPFQANNFLHPLHQVSQPIIKGHEENVEIIQRERLQVLESDDPWSGDEVLALLRIRSSLDNWFPEFTWELVSRKLADLGFKKSAEKCREKFEEESRYFTNINNNNSYNKNNNYRVFGELEELYNENPHEEEASENKDKMDKPSQEEERQEAAEEKGEGGEDKLSQEESRNDDQKTEEEKGEDNGRTVEKSKVRKRKRSEERFEIIKKFCEGIVQKILAQQEEMHVKLIEDMVRRDEEKFAREEQWKRQEMERINKELELRAHEQALASDRQAKIIEFLKKFISPSGSSIEVLGDRSSQDPVDQIPFGSTITSSPSSVNPSPLVLSQNPNHTSQDNNNQSKVLEASISSPEKITKPKEPTPLAENQSPQNPNSSLEHPNPNSLNTQDEPSAPSPLPTDKMHKMSTPNKKDDSGNRWPRDEVLALINTRCNLYNNNDQDKEGAVKAPLWERISQGMLELGYKRSAKRCKEKWENINKYFRKTKDLNKTRSVDSRTCPYFHQLNALYNQGKLTTTMEGSNSCLESP